MKAKVYYSLPEAHRISDTGATVPYLVIPVSAMDKVIEQAARGIFLDRMRRNPCIKELKLTWATLPEGTKVKYRADARAAYKAGGFVS